MSDPSEMKYWRDALASAPTHDRDGESSGWLAASWDEPDGFFAALMGSASEANSAVPLKSVFGEAYDIYHDAVVRHAGDDKVALRWYHRERGWQTLSYRDLHQRCERLAASWAEAGVEPGSIVALVLPFGVDMAIALATGFSLGACVSPLPPLGRDYTFTRRLVGLAPTHVVADMMYHGLLGDFLDMLLPGPGTVAGPASSPAVASHHSHTYAPGEVCALIHSPLRTEHDVPVELTCDDAYLRSLRDGHLLLGLGTGDSLAAPGFSPLQYQPCLLLATWLAGATYVHVTMSALEAAPGLLMDRDLGNLGISAELRDLLMARRPRGKARWRQWFRNAEDGSQSTAWQDFIDGFALNDIPVCNAIFEAASGGALLFKRSPDGTAHMRSFMNLRAAPGVPWSLLDSSLTGQESVGRYGALALGADDAVITHIMVSRYRALDLIYMGTVEPRRDGWVYPSPEVIAALDDLPYVQAASVVAEPMGDGLHYGFVLLVFTGYHGVANPDIDDGRRREIAGCITNRVGEPFAPDRIQLFPLYARLEDGAAADGWCAEQYRRGMLYRKSRMPLFASLTALRYAAEPESSG